MIAAILEQLVIERSLATSACRPGHRRGLCFTPPDCDPTHLPAEGHGKGRSNHLPPVVTPCIERCSNRAEPQIDRGQTLGGGGLGDAEVGACLRSAAPFHDAHNEQDASDLAHAMPRRGTAYSRSHLGIPKRGA